MDSVGKQLQSGRSPKEVLAFIAIALERVFDESADKEGNDVKKHQMFLAKANLLLHLMRNCLLTHLINLWPTALVTSYVKTLHRIFAKEGHVRDGKVFSVHIVCYVKKKKTTHKMDGIPIGRKSCVPKFKGVIVDSGAERSCLGWLQAVACCSLVSRSEK